MDYSILFAVEKVDRNREDSFKSKNLSKGLQQDSIEDHRSYSITDDNILQKQRPTLLQMETQYRKNGPSTEAKQSLSSGSKHLSLGFRKPTMKSK